MDAVLCLRETTRHQSMELERPKAVYGLESGTRSRLWSTGGDCARRQEVAFFGLRKWRPLFGATKAGVARRFLVWVCNTSIALKFSLSGGVSWLRRRYSLVSCLACY